MGPGNPMDNGPPVDKDDWASWFHDRAYKRYEDEQGLDPKKVWVPEDDKWLEETDWKGWSAFGKAWFNAKKGAYKAGLIPKATLAERKPVPPTLSGYTTPRKNPYKRPKLPTMEPKTKEPSQPKQPGEEQVPPSTEAQQQLQSNQNAMSNGVDLGSGNQAGLKETPIDDVGHVERGPPEYTFASLPYYRDHRNVNTYWGQDIGFRMTSPLDPSIDAITAVDLNAGAGTVTFIPLQASDASDTTQVSARWFDFYASLYNYYHVIAAKWHVTIENLSSEPIWCHQFYCNDEYPPQGATNEDIQCWKDAESHFVGTHAVAMTTNGIVGAQQSNSNANNVEGAASSGTNYNYLSGNMVQSKALGPLLKLSGTYNPGDFKRQIHLDAEIENWTAVTANPLLPERLVFRFKPYWNAIDTNNASSYDRTIQFRMTFKIDYLVEFKELKVGLRWPVERQPVTAAIVNNIEEDEEP